METLLTLIVRVQATRIEYHGHFGSSIDRSITVPYITVHDCWFDLPTTCFQWSEEPGDYFVKNDLMHVAHLLIMTMHLLLKLEHCMAAEKMILQSSISLFCWTGS